MKCTSSVCVQSNPTSAGVSLHWGGAIRSCLLTLESSSDPAAPAAVHWGSHDRLQLATGRQRSLDEGPPGTGCLGRRLRRARLALLRGGIPRRRSPAEGNRSGPCLGVRRDPRGRGPHRCHSRSRSSSSSDRRSCGRLHGATPCSECGRSCGGTRRSHRARGRPRPPRSGLCQEGCSRLHRGRWCW